jgi:hypothetical protein
MLQEQFDILGYWMNEVYFKLDEKIICIKKKLPREDLILKLKVEPEDVKALRDEILVQASKKPLSYDQRMEFFKEIYE